MKLSVEHLKLSFGEQLILNDLSFAIKEKEFVTILGPSGCGKSTILNILAGLLNDYSGTIQVDGQEIHGVSEHFAYMPQDDLLLEWRTILDNVTLYGKIHHDQSAKQNALAEFKTFGLEGYENAYPSALSGGMRQRAAFLRTSLCQADILLLDEPFGALDVITRNDMQDWLLNLRKQYNRTTLLVTHDIDEALYLSDRIFVLSNKPSVIIKEIDLSKEQKSREWLFSQSKIKQEIFNVLKGENNA
ncbi:MAG: ABC transporter ATP-binding protein [Erysipelotrichaceae bacterium]|nr:ABC transporter ATP-binding protein [Erysipelotrichaceae bacterium]